MEAKRQAPSPSRILFGLGVVLAIGVALVEKLFRFVGSRYGGAGQMPAKYAPIPQLLGQYGHVRDYVVAHWLLLAIGGAIGFAVLFLGVKKLAALMHYLREKAANFAFKKETYALQRAKVDLPKLIAKNRLLDSQVVVGTGPSGSRRHTMSFRRWSRRLRSPMLKARRPSLATTSRGLSQFRVGGVPCRIRRAPTRTKCSVLLDGKLDY